MNLFKALCRQILISLPQYVVFSQMTISDGKPKCAAVHPAVKDCQNAGQVTFKLLPHCFSIHVALSRVHFCPRFSPHVVWSKILSIQLFKQTGLSMLLNMYNFYIIF